MSTATKERTLQQVLDEAQPIEIAPSLRKVLLGTILVPLKRTFAGLAVQASHDLTAIDGVGEIVGAGNPLRLAAFAVRTLRLTAGQVSHALAGGTDAVKATLDLATKSAHIDIVIRAKVAGTGGNAITIATVADAGAQAGSITEVGNVITVHYKDAVSTVADIRALLATSTLVDMVTTGTGATVLHDPADTFAAANLAGGLAAVKASVNMATVGSGEIDCVLEAQVAGVVGNGKSVKVIGDSAAGAGVTLSETSTITTIHYESGVSTDGAVEAKITASSTLLDVKTPGTAGTVINDQEAGSGGSYRVTDAGGTAVDAGTKVGIATISDDGKTITFASANDGFVIEYVPRTLPAADWSAAFATSPGTSTVPVDSPNYSGPSTDSDTGYL